MEPSLIGAEGKPYHNHFDTRDWFIQQALDGLDDGKVQGDNQRQTSQETDDCGSCYHPWHCSLRATTFFGLEHEE